MFQPPAMNGLALALQDFKYIKSVFLCFAFWLSALYVKVLQLLFATMRPTKIIVLTESLDFCLTDATNSIFQKIIYHFSFRLFLMLKPQMKILPIKSPFLSFRVL